MAHVHTCDGHTSKSVILAPLLLPVAAVRGACLDDTYVNLFCNYVSYFFTLFKFMLDQYVCRLDVYSNN